MASRRDELNAYTFAKRRLLAAFLQPSPSGTEEGAPKPLRTVVPSLVAGALTLAVFGAWGMFQPTAPSGWDEPGARVIVGKQSTTRYVVLKTDGDTRLHPVLNLASARLLMKDGTYEVVQVGDDVLDSGRSRAVLSWASRTRPTGCPRPKRQAGPNAGPSANSPAARGRRFRRLRSSSLRRRRRRRRAPVD